MPSESPTQLVVQRIVVNGWTYWQSQVDNTEEAHAMLSCAFASKSRWPAGRATFTVTPGGFIRASLPSNYGGGRGWESAASDLDKLAPCARAAVDCVVSGKALQAARRRTKYLTLGVDLNREGQKEGRVLGDHRCSTKCPSTHTHAELVAIFDTDIGEVVSWTGKSYPVDGQQHTLVHVVDLGTHLFEVCSERILVLGCHDLHMFSSRGRKSSRPSRKMIRKQRMRELAGEFKPTIILHHPHTTYSPNVWSGAWGATVAALPTVHTWASGVAFCGNPKVVSEWQPHQTLEKTRRATTSDTVSDVVVKGCGS